MRHELTNDNSREIADLVLSQPIAPKAKASTLQEAQAKAKQYLESIA